MGKVKQPLAEVFGFPSDNQSAEAKRCRSKKLCPYGNRVPNCTKDRANDPLGVCSINSDDDRVIVCPVRYRERWLIAEDAASFFFSEDSNWTSLAEVRLTDASGKSAGNIDYVLVSYDNNGEVVDFGALEIQAVYISGNIRRPFAHFMANQGHADEMDWSKQTHYPRPDYLSSSRKRLAPQLLYKGGIFKSWRKKIAVALQDCFFKTLPNLTEVSKEAADVAWLVYDLEKDSTSDAYKLAKKSIVYTKFKESLDSITRAEPGEIRDFIDLLQTQVDEKLEKTPPETQDADAPF
jgi:hypothetical protein